MDKNFNHIWWLIPLLVVMIVVSGFMGYNEAYKNCKYSNDGYLKTYEWEDGWAESCEREGKIFTMSSTGEGYANNTRCAIEEDGK